MEWTHKFLTEWMATVEARRLPPETITFRYTKKRVAKVFPKFPEVLENFIKKVESFGHGYATKNYKNQSELTIGRNLAAIYLHKNVLIKKEIAGNRFDEITSTLDDNNIKWFAI